MEHTYNNILIAAECSKHNKTTVISIVGDLSPS
jgi:hypothetical protein